MGSIIGTDRRVARADFRTEDDKHNFDCWDTTRKVTSLLLVLEDWRLLKFHTWEPALSRQYACLADPV